MRNRALFKCVDLGELDQRFIDGNLTQQFKVELRNHSELSGDVQYDEAQSELYTRHSYEKDPLKKILFKANDHEREPRDIFDVSNLIGREESVRIKRAYVSGDSQIDCERLQREAFLLSRCGADLRLRFVYRYGGPYSSEFEAA